MSGYPPQPYILQSGTITPGHGLVWAANGVVEDSGSPPIDLPSGPEGYYLTASGLPGTVVYVQPNSAGGPAILDSNNTLSEQLVTPAGTTTALSLATIAASQVANGIPAGSSGALLGLTGVAGIGQSVTTLKNLTIAANASAFPTVAQVIGATGLSDDQNLYVTEFATGQGSGGGTFKVTAASGAIPDQFINICPSALLGNAATSGTLFTGNGSATTFAGTLPSYPLVPSSPNCPTPLTITIGSVVATDGGNGLLTGTGVSAGTINYATGAYSITYSAAPSSGATATNNAYSYATSTLRALRNYDGALRPSWFGVTFNSVTDDTAAWVAIQNFAALQNPQQSNFEYPAFGACIEMPSGTSLFSGTIPVYSGVSMKGQGKYQTMLKATSASAQLHFYANAEANVGNPGVGGACSGFRVHGSNITTGALVIIDICVCRMFFDMLVDFSLNTGIELNGTQNCYFCEVDVQNNGNFASGSVAGANVYLTNGAAGNLWVKSEFAAPACYNIHFSGAVEPNDFISIIAEYYKGESASPYYAATGVSTVVANVFSENPVSYSLQRFKFCNFASTTTGNPVIQFLAIGQSNNPFHGIASFDTCEFYAGDSSYNQGTVAVQLGQSGETSTDAATVYFFGFNRFSAIQTVFKTYGTNKAIVSKGYSTFNQYANMYVNDSGVLQSANIQDVSTIPIVAPQTFLAAPGFFTSYAYGLSDPAVLGKQSPSSGQNILLRLLNGFTSGALNEPTIAFDNNSGTAIITFGAQVSGSNPYVRFLNNGTEFFRILANSGAIETQGGMGLFGKTPVTTQPTITGSRGSATATVLEALLQALQSYGLITDSTTS